LLCSHCRTASEHHPTSALVVLRVDRSAQGKTGQKVRGQAPCGPAPEKVGGSIDPLDPVDPRPLECTALRRRAYNTLALP